MWTNAEGKAWSLRVRTNFLRPNDIEILTLREANTREPLKNGKSNGALLLLEKTQLLAEATLGWNRWDENSGAD